MDSILIVEDNPGDVELIMESFRIAKISNETIVAKDGVEAIGLAVSEMPIMIILDLNLPRKDGRAVLYELKNNEKTSDIPIVVLTSSQAEEDILRSYKLKANCYVSKPLDYKEFIRAVQSIADFWLKIVRLPGRTNGIS